MGNVELTRSEKLKLQVMRVQIQLISLGLYDGAVDGVLGAQTVQALKQFQLLKSLPASGQMTTETMNALGVPVVN
ncbi:peptidoglycan-binding protein [Alcaligenes faecalis]|nr:peptidoglycan-binding protein [Alcaligenes faecalis]